MCCINPLKVIATTGDGVHDDADGYVNMMMIFVMVVLMPHTSLLDGN